MVTSFWYYMQNHEKWLVSKEKIFFTPFNKHNHEELQELQECVDELTKFYEYLIDHKNEDFIREYCTLKSNELYYVQCAYVRDPSRVLELARHAYTFYILIELVNQKYYSQSQSPIECNQLGD